MGYEQLDPLIEYGSDWRRLSFTKDGSANYGDYASGMYGAAVVSASATTPIAVQATGHGLTTGARVALGGVAGGHEGNGVWYVDVVDANNVTLRGSSAATAGTANTGWLQQVDGAQVLDSILIDNGSTINNYVAIDVYAGDYSPGDTPLFTSTFRNRANSHPERNNGLGRNWATGIKSPSGFVIEGRESDGAWTNGELIKMTALFRRTT